MAFVGWRKFRSSVDASPPTERLHRLMPLGATSHCRYMMVGTA